VKPSIVLIGGTIEGRTIAPRLAVEYRSGLTADCTKLDIDEAGHLIQTRPAFGGNIMASIITETARPQFATVRQGIYEKPARLETAEVPVEFFDFSVTGRKIKLLGTEKIINKNNLTDQKVLVVAGNGVKRKEDLEMLRDLADLLGGRLASSRALVEKGWMTPGDQIGLSGSAVCPKCMITCGVSGSVQFMAGMKTTPNIIAINTDANAAIFDIAHYPICADLYEIIPELLNILKS
jgi:electron transfer flavoprotein alpha subunit